MMSMGRKPGSNGGHGGHGGHGGRVGLQFHLKQPISGHTSSESLGKEKKIDDWASGAPEQPTILDGYNFSASLELLNQEYGQRYPKPAVSMSESAFTESGLTEISTQPSQATSDTNWEIQSWPGGCQDEGLTESMKDLLEKRVRQEELRRRRQAESFRKPEGILRHRSAPPQQSRRKGDGYAGSAMDARGWVEIDEAKQSEKRHSLPKAGQEISEVMLGTVGGSSTGPWCPIPTPKTIRRVRRAQDLRTEEKDGCHMVMAKIAEEDDEENDGCMVTPTSISRQIAIRLKDRLSHGRARTTKRPTSMPPRTRAYSPTLMTEESDGDTSMEYDCFSVSESSDDLPPIRPDDPSAPRLGLAVNELMKHYDSWRSRQGNTASEQGANGKGPRWPGKDSGRAKKRSQPDQESPTTGDDDSDAVTKTSKRRKSIAQNGRKLACPFWKRDQDAHRDCYKKVLSAIKYVKSHLYKFHETPIFCPVCGETFRDEGVRDLHIRARCCRRRCSG